MAPEKTKSSKILDSSLVVKMHNFAVTQNFKIGSDSTINIGSSGDLFRGLGVVITV
jgi:hypothetical protein